MKSDLWTRDELILIVNRYLQIQFEKMYSRNPEIIHLANLLDRTPGDVAFKLVNFASMDPALYARGVIGASNLSQLDREIWVEFSNNWEKLIIKSEEILAKYENSSIQDLNPIVDGLDLNEGKTRDQLVKIRVKQAVFRKIVLASYNSTCCISGIQNPHLLIAGHIVPWSIDKNNRLNPRNGILMNGLFSKAFENGLITITPTFEIIISTILLKTEKTNILKSQFLKYHKQKIILPSKFLPDLNFLRYHNEVIFKG